MEYASSAWDPFQGTHITALEAVQRRAARFACGNYSREASVSDMLNKLGWRTLQERRFIARQAMFYKTVNQQTATALPSHITPVSSRPTRESHNIRFTVPSTHMDLYLYSYFPRTVRFWNILPKHIVEAQSVDILKELLLKDFLNGHMYMVAPKSTEETPRLGSTSCVSAVGPVY